jgi:hypothetical protein
MRAAHGGCSGAETGERRLPLRPPPTIRRRTTGARELLLNRRHHEVHEDEVVRHAVHPEAPVQLLRDAGRQLRPGFFGLRHLCRLALRSPRTPRTTPTPATTAPVLRARREGDVALVSGRSRGSPRGEAAGGCRRRTRRRPSTRGPGRVPALQTVALWSRWARLDRVGHMQERGRALLRHLTPTIIARGAAGALVAGQLLHGRDVGPEVEQVRPCALSSYAPEGHAPCGPPSFSC